MIVNHPRGASKAPPAETKQHHSERIEVQPDNVPDALSRRPQWVLWRLLKRNGERTTLLCAADEPWVLLAS
jgi:hypothetical protein